MKDLLKRAGFTSILSSLVFLLLGILLVVNPDAMVQAVSYVIGVLLIAIGIVKVISYFTSKDDYLFYDYRLIYGALCIILGILVTVSGNAIASFFRIIIGIWIILSGIARLDLSVRLKGADTGYWILSLLLSILILVAGVYLMFAPGTILVTLGVILIAYSIMDIIESIIFMCNMNKLLK